MTALAFLGLVALATAGDALSLAWHYARDARATQRMIVIGCVLEIVNTIPIVIAVELGEWWPLAAGVVGSAIGTLLGAKRASADR